MKIIFYIVLVLGLYRVITPLVRGMLGELKVRFKLSKLPKDEYKVLNDILLTTKRGTTQIDHVVISVYGIFVIETKNYKGRIIGNSNRQEWIKESGSSRYYFRNPIKQNRGHVKALANSLRIDEDSITPIVVFLNECKLDVKTKKLVLHIDRLLPAIEKSKDIIFSKKQVVYFAKIIRLLNRKGLSAKLKHIKYVKKREKAKRKRKFYGSIHKKKISDTSIRGRQI